MTTAEHDLATYQREVAYVTKQNAELCERNNRLVAEVLRLKKRNEELLRRLEQRDERED